MAFISVNKKSIKHMQNVTCNTEYATRSADTAIEKEGANIDCLASILNQTNSGLKLCIEMFHTFHYRNVIFGLSVTKKYFSSNFLVPFTLHI